MIFDILFIDWTKGTIANEEENCPFDQFYLYKLLE